MDYLSNVSFSRLSIQIIIWVGDFRIILKVESKHILINTAQTLGTECDGPTIQ